MENRGIDSSSAVQEKPPSSLWVIEARGPNAKDLLDRAGKFLKEAEGITIIDEPGYYNGLLFQKDDNIIHKIDPKDEQWGYTVGGGQVMNLELVMKNEKKKKKFTKKKKKTI